jgi:hypothetical protein
MNIQRPRFSRPAQAGPGGCPRRRLISLLLLLLGLALGAAPGLAATSGGRDVNFGKAPARVTAQGNSFELVGVAYGDGLTIYLDRRADNEPVVGAKLNVDWGDGKAVEATPLGDGVYGVTGKWISRPGRYNLVFTLRTDQGPDRLAGTLDITAPAATAAAPLSRLPGIDNVVAFLLGMLTLFAIGRLSGSPIGVAWAARFSAALPPRLAQARTGIAGLGAGAKSKAASMVARLQHRSADIARLGMAAKGKAADFVASPAGRFVGPAEWFARTRHEAATTGWALASGGRWLGSSLLHRPNALVVAVAFYLIVMALFLAGRSVFAS